MASRYPLLIPQPGPVQKITQQSLHVGEKEDGGFADEIIWVGIINFGIKSQPKGVYTDKKELTFR